MKKKGWKRKPPGPHSHEGRKEKATRSGKPVVLCKAPTARGKEKVREREEKRRSTKHTKYIAVPKGRKKGGRIRVATWRLFPTDITCIEKTEKRRKKKGRKGSR